MATKKPAKIASNKKGTRNKKLCPECETDMVVSKILRDNGPSGMFWLCQEGKCNTLVAISGARAGVLKF